MSCCSSEHPPICNLKQAEGFLYQHGIDFLENVEESVTNLILTQEWVDLLDIENDVNKKLYELHCKVLPNSFECTKMEIFTKTAVDCVFFNKFHDLLILLVHQQFQAEDEEFFDKSMKLCNVNVTAEQLGAPTIYAIPLLAAVVELTNLDNYKSPLEKMQCLCTTYDLIFAELKTAMIDVISKFSEGENEIPIINNTDVLPILMTVIIRSKLLHVCSSLYYIETFLSSADLNEDIRYILNNFKEAVSNIKTITSKNLKPGCDKAFKDLNLVEFIQVSNEIKNISKEAITPLDGYVLRVTDLIVTATNENHPVV